MSTQELVPVKPKSPILANERGVQLSTLDELLQFAQMVANSGLAPRDLKSPEAIVVALQHGMELGLSPAQALQSIAVINGRPCVWGDGAIALVKAHPECEDVIETIEGGDSEGITATCEVLRRGKAPVKRRFTVAMAKKAGLWGKSGPWTQYPARMLQMRARSWAMRDAFPDALKGVGIAEEVRDTSKQANAREVPTAILPEETIRLDAPDAIVPDTGTLELELTQ